MSSRTRKKRNTFRAAKEVKRLARIRLGSPPPAQREESKKHKPPKHRKREAESQAEE